MSDARGDYGAEVYAGAEENSAAESHEPEVYAEVGYAEEGYGEEGYSEGGYSEGGYGEVAYAEPAPVPPQPEIPDYLKSSRYGQPQRIVIQRVVANPGAPSASMPMAQPAYLAPPAYMPQPQFHAPEQPVYAAPQPHDAQAYGEDAQAYDMPVLQSGGGAVASFRSRSAAPAAVAEPQPAPERSGRGMAIAMTIAVTIMLTGLGLLYLPEDKAVAEVPVVFHDYVVEVVCGSRGAPFDLEVSAPDKKAAARAVSGELEGCQVRKVTSVGAATTAPVS